MIDYAITLGWGACVIGTAMVFSGKGGDEPTLDFFSTVFFGAIFGSILFFGLVLPSLAIAFGIPA